MPAHQQSLRVTEAYRERMVGIRDAARRAALGAWRQVDFEALDGSFPADLVAAAVSGLQQQAVRASAGYVGAYVSSERASRAPAPPIDPAPYVGRTRDGQELVDALRLPLITVKAAIAERKPDPMDLGRVRLLRLVGLATDAAARGALSDLIQADDRLIGWRRAVRGTCGACLGAATGRPADPGESMDIHPGCQCVSEPIVVGAPDRIRRPSGASLFAAMTAVAQDQLLGPEKAELVRTGAADLADLVDHSPMKHEDDYLTERPLEALT